VAQVNVVNQVLNKIGGQCFQPVAATSAGGLMANASQSLGNMAEIMKVSAALDQHPAMQASSGPQIGGGGSSGMMSFVAGAAIAAGVALINPAAGALMGAGSAVHAGLQSMKPSNQYYNLAKVTTNDDDGGMPSYTDTSGETYLMSGQKAPAPNPMAGNAKVLPLDYAAMKVASANSVEDMQDGIQAKFRQQMADFGAAQKALKLRHDIDLEGIPNLDDALKVAELKGAGRPAPFKALNIGMGSPSMG
jgi:hypothetical protein